VILFLDIDGVLHSRPEPGEHGETDLFASLHLLEGVLRQAPNAEVVIASSWREHHPLEEMREYFAEDVRDRIVGVTPVLAGGLRHAECLAWLAQHRPAGTRWLALDDDAGEFEPGCANLLPIDGTVGLTADTASELLERLLAPRKLGEVLDALHGPDTPPALRFDPHRADIAPTLRMPETSASEITPDQLEFLTGYANGALSRPEAMRRLGFTSYGELVDAMDAAGMRIELPQEVLDRTDRSTNEVLFRDDLSNDESPRRESGDREGG
jgi:hypothetical protein